MSDFSKQIEEWKNAKTIKFVRWFTCMDSDVCSICKSRAGKKFLLDEVEKLIPAHEGCRCWISPIADMDLYEKKLHDILGGDESAFS